MRLHRERLHTAFDTSSGFCYRAIKAGQHERAIRHYTAALAAAPPPLPPAAAVLHQNRGAAHQGMASLAEAIADCGRARALDPTYAKVPGLGFHGLLESAVCTKSGLGNPLISAWRVGGQQAGEG